MQRNITVRDWELLSEYVDGVLNPRDQQRFEARLAEDKNLADQLRRLEHTRSLLQRIPSARTPRHFTLSPEMVKGRSGLFHNLSLSLNAMSAIASLLLVAVLMGEILAFGPPVPASGSASRSVEAAEEPIALMAPAAAAEAAESGADTAIGGESESQADEDFAGDTDQFDQSATEAQANISTEAASTKEASEAPGFVLTRQTYRAAELLLALFAVGFMLLAKRPKR